MRDSVRSRWSEQVLTTARPRPPLVRRKIQLLYALPGSDATRVCTMQIVTLYGDSPDNLIRRACQLFRDKHGVAPRLIAVHLYGVK